MQGTYAARVFQLAMLSASPLLAQVNPDLCRQVRQDDVATLISLHQSTVETSETSSADRCEFEVKTPLSTEGGEVKLTIRRFDSHAEAVAYMKNELPFYFDKKAPLVKTTGPDDHVDDLLNRPDFAMAEAVHGDAMTEVEANRIEPGARAHPTFEYRLQRLALQAAGATVLPTIGLPPDPVRPKPQDANASSGQSVSSGSFFSRPSGIVMMVLVVLVLGVATNGTIRCGGRIKVARSPVRKRTTRLGTEGNQQKAGCLCACFIDRNASTHF